MEYVLYEVQDSIGIITINRPEALNALNIQVLSELKAAFEQVDSDAVRCLILTGAGERSFVAGADIAQMKGLTRKEAAAFGKAGNDTFLVIENCPVPVIAAVNGYALGGGCEISLACDIRLCSENAVFGQPETSLGITPGFGGTQRLARIVGMGRAKEMIYTARLIKADEALKIGLADHMYPQKELMDAAKKLAEAIAVNAPIAVRNSKKAINEGNLMKIEDGVAVEEKLFGDCFQTEDQLEGMTAFLEKRKPKPYRNK